jgi:sporulation protein YlmC with PRC-barrel domain
MMRNWLVPVACGIILAAGLSGRAQAQQSGSDRAARGDLDEIRNVSALRKADVMNQANEKIASLSDLILLPDGKVRYAVLGVGGVVGIGAKYTAIPWDKLDARHVNGKWAVNLNMTKETLEKAPQFESDDYRELTNPQWVARVREFFASQGGTAAVKEKDRPSDSQEGLTTFLRASRVIGAKLRNSNDEKLGSVEDLLLDRNDRAAFAIVGHGGVLGIGENYIPVPWSKLKFSHRPEDTTTLVAMIDITKDQFEKAPLVKGDNYATMLAPGFTDQVFRFFGMEKP